jgi:defect-in-organelle-trafficking protein DotB
MIDLFPNEPRIRWDHSELNDLLLWAFKSGMSDMCLRSGDKVWIRLHGRWRSITERAITADELLAGLERMTKNNSVGALLKSGQKDYDFAHIVDEGRGLRQRFRGNALSVADGYSTGVKMVFRAINATPPQMSALSLEQDIWDHCFPEEGLVLVTGKVGSGKTTLLASMLREIIEQGGRHVVSYEAPIEFDLTAIPNPGGPVSQTSIPEHLADFQAAIRNSTRTAPDVVLVGEARDLETMRGTIESADTGVAVYATVHSRSVPNTISRILKVFPQEEHGHIAASLISSLRLIISQRLITHPSGNGRTALREYLPFTSEIRERLLETSVDRLGPVTEELVKTHGQSLIIPAKAAYDEGRIAREKYLAIEMEYRPRQAASQEKQQEEYVCWPPMMFYGGIPLLLPKSSFSMPAPFFPLDSGSFIGPGGQRASLSPAS